MSLTTNKRTKYYERRGVFAVISAPQGFQLCARQPAMRGQVHPLASWSATEMRIDGNSTCSPDLKFRGSGPDADHIDQCCVIRCIGDALLLRACSPGTEASLQSEMQWPTHYAKRIVGISIMHWTYWCSMHNPRYCAYCTSSYST